MSNKAIVLDANILIRAVLGKRVRERIVACADARKYLPELLEKRGANSEAALQRIAMRDADDWPVLACAMTTACPIWTEDADFFGAGIATWTTDRVELYLAG